MTRFVKILKEDSVICDRYVWTKHFETANNEVALYGP